MRYEIPNHLKGKELLQHLYANKAEIKKQKKAAPVKSMPIGFDDWVNTKQSENKMYIPEQPSIEYGQPFERSVIQNLCGWMDSYDDVSLRGSFNRTVNNNAKMMYFMRDHSGSTKDIIADLKEVRVDNIALSHIGISSEVEMQEALVFRAEFNTELDEQAYYAYYNGLAKQHSIGMRYIKIELGINDPDFEEEYKYWERNYSQIINKQLANERGYFWGVEEQKVFEGSWVLLGANSETGYAPQSSTPIVSEPAKSTSDKKDPVTSNLHQKLFISRNGY